MISKPNDQEKAQTICAAKHHAPSAGEFLYLPPWAQSYAYRTVDSLFAHRVIRRGPDPQDMPRGPELIVKEVDGSDLDFGSFMMRNALVGTLVIHRGNIVLERYALGLREHDRWSTMSTVKSMTAILVGAALHDGALTSIDEDVSRYLPELERSAYDAVTIRHLLTMSSGVAWNEDYADKNSDVNRYSRSLADGVPGGVLNLMKSLKRLHPPGTNFLYNSGDTYLLGAVVTRAVGTTLAEYMSKKIWQPVGMEYDGFYTLESEGGQEIGGSRAGMTLRDFGRFAQFVLDDGKVGGVRVLPVGWIDEVSTPAFTTPVVEGSNITHYGYSWWLGEGVMSAIGHAGQRIDIFREEDLIVVTLGAFPQPAYVPKDFHNHRGAVIEFTDKLRRHLKESMG